MTKLFALLVFVVGVVSQAVPLGENLLIRFETLFPKPCSRLLSETSLTTHPICPMKRLWEMP